MKEKFIEFLKANKCYTAFVESLKRDHNADIDGLCERNDPELWISCAFDWEATPQGHNYWFSLSMNWKASINEEE